MREARQPLSCPSISTSPHARWYRWFRAGVVRAVGEDTDENVGFGELIALVRDGPWSEVTFEGAEAFFDPHEVAGGVPEFGGWF